MSKRCARRPTCGRAMKVASVESTKSASRRSALIAGITLFARPAVGRAQTVERIRLSAVPGDALTAVYYGVRNEIYQRAGLEVEIVPASSGTASTTAVIAGTYEMGHASPIAAVVAHLRGIPVVVATTSVLWERRRPWNVIT